MNDEPINVFDEDNEAELQSAEDDLWEAARQYSAVGGDLAKEFATILEKFSRSSPGLQE